MSGGVDLVGKVVTECQMSCYGATLVELAGNQPLLCWGEDVSLEAFCHKTT